MVRGLLDIEEAFVSCDKNGGSLFDAVLSYKLIIFAALIVIDQSFSVVRRAPAGVC